MEEEEEEAREEEEEEEVVRTVCGCWMGTGKIRTNEGRAKKKDKKARNESKVD